MTIQTIAQTAQASAAHVSAFDPIGSAVTMGLALGAAALIAYVLREAF